MVKVITYSHINPFIIEASPVIWEFYLNYVNKLRRHPSRKASIGITLDLDIYFYVLTSLIC